MVPLGTTLVSPTKSCAMANRREQTSSPSRGVKRSKAAPREAPVTMAVRGARNAVSLSAIAGGARPTIRACPRVVLLRTLPKHSPPHAHPHIAPTLRSSRSALHAPLSALPFTLRSSRSALGSSLHVPTGHCAWAISEDGKTWYKFNDQVDCTSQSKKGQPHNVRALCEGQLHTGGPSSPSWPLLPPFPSPHLHSHMLTYEYTAALNTSPLHPIPFL